MSDSDAPLAVRSRLGVEVELARLRRRYGEFPVESRTVENEVDYFLHGMDVAREGWIGAAGAWVSDADDRVLFVRHADAPEEWCLPGGAREAEEGLDGTAAREVREETGVVCALSGVWRAERKRIVLGEDPERRYYLLDANFEARYVDGSLELADDDEILEARWFDERPDSVVAFARGKADDWFEG
ncbi:NUDIX hydrolase [Halomarina litorea]|uniref:NUDIX hydrolase n=1 Tax=Halomarina litorea TaxID=2961595 RepID=UPI0020C4E197|nr:NUDIX hydrolase [Halomarina sp. BCD28]